MSVKNVETSNTTTRTDALNAAVNLLGRVRDWHDQKGERKNFPREEVCQTIAMIRRELNESSSNADSIKGQGSGRIRITASHLRGEPLQDHRGAMAGR